MATTTAAPSKPILDSAQRAWLARMGAALQAPLPKSDAGAQPAADAAAPQAGETAATKPSNDVAAADQKEPPADPNAEKFEKETLKVGSKGPAVEHLQKQLNANGASLEVDGKFGPATEKAVKEFQKSKSLTVDGVVGQKTWGALKASKPAPPEKDTKPRTVVFQVTDGATNDAIEDAVVKVGEQTEKTGNTGQATFSLPPGEFVFGVTADGFEQVADKFEVKTSDESRINVEMKAGERVTKVLLTVNPSGKSNKDDKIKLEAKVTVGGGRTPPPGRVEFSVSLNGSFRQTLATVQLQDGKATHIESRLTKGSHVLHATYTPTPPTQGVVQTNSNDVNHEVFQSESSRNKDVAKRIATVLDEDDREGIEEEVIKLHSPFSNPMARLLNIMVLLQKAGKAERLLENLPSDRHENHRIIVAILTAQHQFTKDWFKFFQKLSEPDRKGVLARTPANVIAKFELDNHPVDPPDPDAEPDDPNAEIVIEPDVSTKAKITFHSPTFGFRETTPEFEVTIGPNGQVKGDLAINMEVVKKEIKRITALGPVLDLEGKVSLSAGAEFEQHKNEIVAEVQASVKGEFQLKFPEIRGVLKNVALKLEIQFDLDGKFEFGGAISIPIPSL